MTVSKKQFRQTGINRPGKSAFPLDYSKLFNCGMGELIPVMHDEVVPGDVFDIRNEIVIRMQPLVAPVLHEINCYVHYFFVPYRILDDDWEDFITGGEDGDDDTTLPRWATIFGNEDYSLWDYMGFAQSAVSPIADTTLPLQYPLNAYNMIWNEWYRDENIQDEIVLNLENETYGNGLGVLYRNWEKDYFTSCLPWQQRGTAPALPISGTTSAVWDSGDFAYHSSATIGDQGFQNDSALEKFLVPTGYTTSMSNMTGFFDNNEVDLSGATTFDVADLRLAFQIQRWMERNARAGVRYTEFLRAHFGTAPRDERLDRPEYIGGTKQNVIVSEVLQTSETDTSPQGTLAGHGISASGGKVGRYRVEEYGIIMGLLSIMPRTSYSQGINRQWLRDTRYDFYSPEFANLSEQAVMRGEIYWTDSDSNNETIFGYQGRYDEMRTKQDLYCGDMRDAFDYWHLGRKFTSAPTLNNAFLQCVPDTRIFAVESAPGFIVHHQNIIRAYRPMPYMSNPGLIDH